MRQQFNYKFKKGFSLVETLVTLIVVSIIIIMLTNVLSITLKVSVLASERAHIKNEMSSIFQKLDRDVANAEYVHIPAVGNVLILETADHRVRWQLCENNNHSLSTLASPNSFALCQYYCALVSGNDLDDSTCPPASSRLQTITSPKLVIRSFSVEEIQSTSNFENQRIKSAVVTIRAEHYTDTLRPEKGLGIKNIYKQLTISSNNFII